jgi:hypothetical protein
LVLFDCFAKAFVFFGEVREVLGFAELGAEFVDLGALKGNGFFGAFELEADVVLVGVFAPFELVQAHS